MTEHPSSFRDPDGGVVFIKGVLHRWLAPAYQPHYAHLHASGLYDAAVGAGLLLAHAETTLSPPAAHMQRLLRPEPLAWVSYPYEWGFAAWQAAALTTLRLQSLALDHGMMLKDASAFNVQWHRGRLVWIDLSSLVRRVEGQPWPAYGQFCRHFLAPLALMAYRDTRLGALLRTHLDGIPLDLAARLLPRRSLARLGLALHLHLHSRASGRAAPHQERRFSSAAFRGLLDQLSRTIQALTPRYPASAWTHYYDDPATGADYLAAKQAWVAQQLAQLQPASTWDLGANDGTFARLATAHGLTISFEQDMALVDQAFRAGQAGQLPLLLDLTNPSPGLGWVHQERQAWLERPRPQLTLALALLHHLTIGNNLPWAHLVRFFADLSPWLITEFVPREDPRVQALLAHRDTAFPSYTQAAYEAAFEQAFTLRAQQVLPGKRILYLWQRQASPL